jgi:phosphatidate cytidylyltransferase
MSYLDPLGGHTSSGDWSPETGDDGRDGDPWARHTGAAPDPYADGRFAQSAAEVDDDPYAAFRSAPADGRGTQFGGPAWDSPTANTPLSPEPEVVADPERPRGPGRRRASRFAGLKAAAAGANGANGSVPSAPRTGRAGRNLRAAIVVGCSLGAVVLAALFIWPPAFLGVIAVAAGVGIWEMVRAVRATGADPPLIPLLGGGLLMIGLAWYAGSDALTLGLLVTVLASVVWRLGDGPADLLRDLTATVLIAVYVPFLIGFGVLLVEQQDGSWRVMITLLAVVLSDTGGYAAGVFLGKRPMAPKISPKKSWEGFGGSVAASALGSALLLFLVLDVPVYWGALFGVLMAVVAVLGDLAESMMKRDIGIKDMSQLLPGHGGLMDRLDSILFAVPAAYLLLSLIAPPG